MGEGPYLRPYYISGHQFLVTLSNLQMSHYKDSSLSLWCIFLFPVASWYLCIFGFFYTCFNHISVYNSSNSCTGTKSDTLLKSLLVCKQNSLHCCHQCHSFACSLSPQRYTQYPALLSLHKKIVIGLKLLIKVLQSSRMQ